MTDPKPLTRRGLLKQTAAVAAGGAALLAQNDADARPPAVKTRRRFKAWISRGEGPGRTTLQEAALRPIGGRQVVVRTEATNLCYSNVPPVLGIQPPGAQRSALAAPPGNRRLNDMAVIQGHGGVGIVEAVGPEVRRVQVGDRVCVSGTPHCGACYRCLRGRSDMCQFLSAIGADDLVAIADLKDGTPVYQNSHIGGLAELMVTFEEWVVPIFTKLPAADVGMACSCVAVAGLGATTAHALMQIEPASSVAVVGCGPLGLSAIQGARIAGATTIIGIDPIGVRREAASKVGATHVLDPNVEGDGLVARVRSLTTWPTSRLWSGGRNPAGRRPGAGADFVIEAAGLAHVPPKLEQRARPDGSPADAAGVSDVRARWAIDHDEHHPRRPRAARQSVHDRRGDAPLGPSGRLQPDEATSRASSRCWRRATTTRRRSRRPSCLSSACSRLTRRSRTARRSRR